MDFSKILLENRSLGTIKSIQKKIGADQKLFDALMNICFYGDDIIAPRASWTAIHTIEKNSSLLKPWIGKIVNRIEKIENQTTKRNLLRLLEEVEIPEKYRGKIIEICYGYISSIHESIAVKVFSMTIICDQVKHHPELKNELELVVKDLIRSHDSPAILSRGKKILKILAKIQNPE